MNIYLIIGGILLLVGLGSVSIKQESKSIFAGLAKVQPDPAIADHLPVIDESVVTTDQAGKEGEPPQRQFKDLNTQEGAALIESNQANANFVILDVRTPEEFSAGHISGALHLDFYASDFRVALNKLDKSKTYFVYCRSGNRSGQAMRMMQADGFITAYNLLGGITQWYGAGLPLE